MNYYYSLFPDYKIVEVVTQKAKLNNIKFSKDLQNHAKTYVFLKRVRFVSTACLFYFLTEKIAFGEYSSKVKMVIVTTSFIFLYTHLNILKTRECLMRNFNCSDEYLKNYMNVFALIDNVEL